MNIFLAAKKPSIAQHYARRIGGRDHNVSICYDAGTIIGQMIGNNHLDYAIVEMGLLKESAEITKKTKKEETHWIPEHLAGKGMGALVRYAKSSNPKIKVVGFSKHRKEDYEIIYPGFNTNTLDERLVLSKRRPTTLETLNNYIFKNL